MTRLSTLILLLLTVIGIIACDEFNEDMKLNERDIFETSGKSLITTYDAPVVINLEEKLKSTDIAGLRTSLPPVNGSLEISQKGIIIYRKNNTFDAPDGDIFALDFLSTDSSIIESDTLKITFVADTSALPCLNGALSDYKIVPKNSNVYIHVLWNDGYCPDKTKNIQIEITEKPAHGTAVNYSAEDVIPLIALPMGTMSYAPNANFTGKDKFLYKLSITDQDDVVHISYAYVFLNVINGSQCQVMANDDYYSFQPYTKSIKLINPLANDVICDGVEIVIDDPLNGTLKEMSKGVYSYTSTAITCDALIGCEPPNDTIRYYLTQGATGMKVSSGTIYITFKQDSTVYCDALPSAEDDHFKFKHVTDTLVLDVLLNDFWCMPVEIENAFQERTYINGTPMVLDGTSIVYPLTDKNMAFEEQIKYAIAEKDNPNNISYATVRFSYNPDQSCTIDIEDMTISYGTNFGFCGGYCKKSLLITHEVIKYHKSAIHVTTDSFPDLNCTEPYSKDAMLSLVSGLNLDTFYALEEIIGCPDCADGGSEWIEIKTKSKVKKVTFEYLAYPEPIESIIDKLRTLINISDTKCK